MRSTRLIVIAAAFLLMPAFGVSPRPGYAVDMTADANFGLEHYLAFTPSRPAVGEPVTMTLVSRSGLPPAGSIRWTLSGAPATDAKVAPGNPTMYTFTPTAPGSYFLTAEFRDHQGIVNTVTMELIIGAGVPDITAFPVPDGYTIGQPVSPEQMFIAVNPNQPRIGQPTMFTLHFRDGFPQGTQVRWELAGGPVANQSVSGANSEVCTFVPTAQTSYFVRATMVDARGSLTGEVSLGFFPMP